MGCCQIRNNNANKIRSEKIFLTQHSLEIDSQLIKELYLNKAWHKLALMVRNQDSVICKERLLWAESPKTLGCLAVSYLARQALKDSQTVAGLIEKLICPIIDGIKLGTDDLRENSLIFLSCFMNSLTEKQVRILLNQKVFNVLLRFFLCSKLEMRMMCARICNYIYIGRPHAQEAFLNENGNTLLLSLIQWTSSDEKKLSALLMFLENVVLDRCRNPQAHLCIRLKDQATWDILKEIKEKWKGHFIENQIQDVLIYLFL